MAWEGASGAGEEGATEGGWVAWAMGAAEREDWEEEAGAKVVGAEVGTAGVAAAQ